MNEAALRWIGEAVKQQEEAMKRGAESLRKIESVFPNFSETLLRHASAMENLVRISQDRIKQFASMHDAIAQAVRKINLEDFYRAQAQLQEPFIKMAEALARMRPDFSVVYDVIRESNEILLNCGWWVYPEWTIPSLRSIVDMHKRGKDDEIDKAILEYFDNNKLNEMVRHWESNPRLANRVKILTEGVKDYQQGRYMVSIRCLLPDVEGIINENSGQQGKITYNQCVKIFKKMISGKYPKDKGSLFYPLALIKFMMALYSENFEWGKPSKKGRHPILHGHNTDFNDQKFSLKIILLIDYVQSVILERTTV